MFLAICTFNVHTYLFFFSGSGVRTVEKRDGAGSNNWGDMKSEVRYVFMLKGFLLLLFSHLFFIVILFLFIFLFLKISRKEPESWMDEEFEYVYNVINFFFIS